MDAKRLYTEKVDAYQAFNAAFRSPQSLRAFFNTYDGLRDGLRVLDAGCGTGAASIALLRALRNRGLEPSVCHAFDLTPAMLERFKAELERDPSLSKVQLRECNVLEMDRLPADWKDYDLVVSVAMLEYVAPTEFVSALAGLRARLARQGRLLLIITRRNWITKPLIGKLWHAHRYRKDELVNAFGSAGLGTPRFLRYPATYFWQNVWAHVLESSPASSAGGD